MKKPTIQLSEIPQDIFSLTSLVTEMLRQCNLKKQAHEFNVNMIDAQDYDDAIQIAEQYVEFE